MSKDWIAWHRDYEDPSSSLARRLQVVRSELRTALALARPTDGELRLISICAGDGRDALPVLAETDPEPKHCSWNSTPSSADVPGAPPPNLT